MGKAAMCIKMLQYLNTGRVYKISRLAELLETNPRNIIEYKKELDEVSFEGNFCVETIHGRNGGYRLNGNAVIPSLKLLGSEKDALKEAFNYIQAKKDFVMKREAENAFAKVMSNIEIEDKKNNLMVVDRYQLSMDEKDIKERYLAIEEAIRRKKTIQMKYQSIKSGLKVHEVDPYKLFIYNNSWFFLGWDNEKNDVLYFKLNRIEEVTILNKHFAVWKEFKEENYFDENGFINHGDFIHCVFLVSGLRKQLMKERVYGKNQIVEELDKDTARVSLDMQNQDMVLSYALNCGTDIKVLEPQWLIDKLKEKCKEIISLYK